MSHVLIGIQARSGSQRLPRKAFEPIGGRMMLDRVIDACKFAALRIQKNGHKCDVVVLTPEGDPIVEEFSPRVSIVEGPEHDVLARYGVALDKYAPDIAVRITGDCPFIPPQIISHFVNIAEANGYDYLSNTDERFRTSIDGSDCEVISARLFAHTVAFASKPYDREHVTTFMRRSPPEWARMATAVNNFDVSHIKLSVDTQEDLDRARKVFDSTYAKLQEASRVYGKGMIHRL